MGIEEIKKVVDAYDELRLRIMGLMDAITLARQGIYPSNPPEGKQGISTKASMLITGVGVHISVKLTLDEAIPSYERELAAARAELPKMAKLMSEMSNTMVLQHEVDRCASAA